MKFKKFNPNDYVMVVKNGKIVRQGLGLSLFYNELTTNIMVAPSTAFDGAFAFDDLVTSDYQRVCVQGVTTYMLTDYEKAVQMLDFSYNRGVAVNEKVGTTMALLEKRINNIIKAIIIREVSKKDVRTVIRCADEMAKVIVEKLAADESITKLGVSIVGVNILGINPNAETRKALEAAAREQILKEQDDAIYMRRNAAIEQERVIKENEINTEIKVAEKELDLKQKAAARKMQIENEEITGRIEIEKKNKELTQFEAENARIKADQEAYALEGIIRAYNNLNVALIEACAMTQMDPAALMARGFMSIGENADKIGNFNITPDLLQTITQGIKTAEQ